MRIAWSKADPRQKQETLSKKSLKQKRTEGLAQVVEYLLSKHEALSLNHHYHHQKRKKKIYTIGISKLLKYLFIYSYVLTIKCCKMNRMISPLEDCPHLISDSTRSYVGIMQYQI
jgi:hypothetical protein